MSIWAALAIVCLSSCPAFSQAVNYDTDLAIELSSPGARGPIPLNVDVLRVGVSSGAMAELSMYNQASILADTVRTLVIGAATESSGIVTLDGVGTQLSTALGVRVGVAGDGSLEVTNGATLTTSNFNIAFSSSGTGTAKVDGVGSRVIATNDAFVGRAGKNALLALDNGSSFAANSFNVGDAAGSSGSVTVSGASQLTVSSQMNVGNSGIGALSIRGTGSKVQVQGNMNVGWQKGSVGNVLISGPGSMLDVQSELRLGTKEATGTIILTDGARASAETLFIGNEKGTGFLIMSGAGTVLDLEKSLFLGFLVGNAALSIRDHAVLNVGGIIYYPTSVGESSGIFYIGGNLESPSSPGYVIADSIQMITSRDFLIFNHTSNDYVFAVPVVSQPGAGTILSLAGVTHFSDVSGFRGNFDIVGGTLTFGSAPNTTVSVSSGGTLGGNPTVGSLSVLDSGILSPGNSIGKITVTGSATFQSGAIYDLEVDHFGNLDQLQVGGALTLDPGAVLSVRPLDAPLSSSLTSVSDKIIATAATGVSGSFGVIEDSFAFLDAYVRYDAQNIYLSLIRNSVGFSALAETENQQFTANAVGNLGANSVLYHAVEAMTESEAAYAFDQLSGAVYGVVPEILFARGDRFSRVLQRRLAADQSPNMASTRYWMTGVRGGARSRGKVFGETLSEQSHLFAAGAEFWSSESALGFALGYGQGDFVVEGSHFGGSTNDIFLGIYGEHRFEHLVLRGVASIAQHDVASARSVEFSGLSERLASDFVVVSGNLYAEAALALPVVNALNLEPFVGFSIGSLDGGFSEGGGVAMLQGELDSDTQMLAALGLRLTGQCLSIRLADVCIDLSASWEHLFDSQRNSSVAFAGGAPFETTIGGFDEHSAQIDLSISAAVSDNASLRFSYSGEFSGRSTSQSAGIRLEGVF